jgi:hypothetical protein
MKPSELKAKLYLSANVRPGPSFDELATSHEPPGKLAVTSTSKSRRKTFTTLLDDAGALVRQQTT